MDSESDLTSKIFDGMHIARSLMHLVMHPFTHHNTRCHAEDEVSLIGDERITTAS